MALIRYLIHPVHLLYTVRASRPASEVLGSAYSRERLFITIFNFGFADEKEVRSCITR
jgi:hypothetical protein